MSKVILLGYYGIAFIDIEDAYWFGYIFDRPFFPPMEYQIKPLEDIKDALENIRYEVEIMREPMESVPKPHEHKDKLLKYDKRRNYSPKNYWNRCRSRCFGGRGNGAKGSKR